MGVFTYVTDATSVIPPPKVFKAFVLDADQLIPKIVPQAIKGTGIIEGDGGPGSIKKITFGEGSEYKYMKHRIDVLDKENFIYSYTIIEGDAIGDKIEKVENEVKIEASPTGGSILKSTSKYYTKDDYELKEDEIKAGKEKALGLFKAIESYLLANPNAY
uniref:Pathogenesis-related protein PR10A n=1 Tax=Datisca glomerata TaxID=34297 RepID=Q7Y083_DATGL|nr:pathogenesis-related protein PR10A [Datisca glomerata]